ncbi:hypothetical protein TRIUR3_02954 [Triticum urartu]|uniref:Uncharacterized protein n=1 Tax=Triticum urartu TaxID=4572 RepID=M7ZCN4_TRIUA|nr:hypothetical protein TRIUR3_02954 [Triticum urartu]
MAALCVLLLLVLLPGEVAAKSKFCRCFDDCFPGCVNKKVPHFLCQLFCANKCSPNQAAVGGDAMCRMACSKLSIKICGWSAAPAGQALFCRYCDDSIHVQGMLSGNHRHPR